MRNKLAVTSVFSASICCICAVGCGSTNGGTTETTAQNSATLLALVTTIDGHTIRFIESTPGDAFIGETSPAGQQPLLGDYVRGKSMEDVYHHIQPNASVPRAIVAADARVTQARASGAQVVAGSPPPNEPQASPAGPKFYTAAEWSWFQSSFCTGSPWTCQNQTAPYLGAYAYGGNYEVYGMLGSENTSISSFILQLWESTSWVTLYSVVANPGDANWWWRVEGTPCGSNCYHRGGFSGGASGSEMYMVAQKNS